MENKNKTDRQEAPCNDTDSSTSKFSTEVCPVTVLRKLGYLSDLDSLSLRLLIKKLVEDVEDVVGKGNENFSNLSLEELINRLKKEIEAIIAEGGEGGKNLTTENWYPLFDVKIQKEIKNIIKEGKDSKAAYTILLNHSIFKISSSQKESLVDIIIKKGSLDDLDSSLSLDLGEGTEFQKNRLTQALIDIKNPEGIYTTLYLFNLNSKKVSFIKNSQVQELVQNIFNSKKLKDKREKIEQIIKMERVFISLKDSQKNQLVLFYTKGKSDTFITNFLENPETPEEVKKFLKNKEI